MYHFYFVPISITAIIVPCVALLYALFFNQQLTDGLDDKVLATQRSCHEIPQLVSQKKYIKAKNPLRGLKRGEYRARTDDLLHAMQAL